MEPLLPHFLQFYEQDEQMSPPVKLEACARIQVGAPVCAIALEPPLLNRQPSLHVRLICGCSQHGACAEMPASMPVHALILFAGRGCAADRAAAALVGGRPPRAAGGFECAARG